MDGILPIIWLALMGGVFYFLLWRPQQRRVQAMRTLHASLRLGDEVVTAGGIHGRIAGIGDAEIDLEIAPGTTVHLDRGAVVRKVTAPEADASQPDSAD